MCIQEAFDSFLLSRELAGLSHKTISSYTDAIRPFLRSLGDWEIGDVRWQDIQTYLSELLKRSVSRATKSCYIRHLKVFLRWTEQEYGISCGADKIKVPKSPRREARIYSPEEVALIFDSVRAESDWLTARNRAVIALMYDSGLRQSEVCSLLRSRISFSENRMIVRGKGDKERTVPIGEITRQYMQEYLRICPYMLDNVFVSREGIPLSGNAVKLMVSRLADTLPFELSSHKLRHNFATNYCIDHMEQKGQVDIYKLMYLMGHEEIKTTQRYLHFAYEILASRGHISHLDKLGKPET